MSTVEECDAKSADRLPDDWKRRVASYRGLSLQHYNRVLRTLSTCDWMTIDERERAAFVIVEKELLREQGQLMDEDDD